MTQRQLDRALLVGIGVLLLIILVLALSPAPLAVGDISDPAVRPSQAAARPGEQTHPARAAATRAPAEVATLPPVPNDSATRERENTSLGDAPPTSRDETPPETTSSQTLAAGVAVERVGFAYATGSEGACGVPLTAWNFVAVSRDLLEVYPCGSAVTLTFADEVAGRSSVTAQVGDTMGAEITDTVNVFVGEDEPALEYGVTSGTLAQ